MASWRNVLGGRYSPFATTAPRSPPQVTESDYHYIGPDDIVDPPREYRNDSYGSRHHGGPRDDASQPDILILRHKGTTYPMHFPPYVIGEGILRVGELRRYAAEKTGVADPRRLKLLYKGRRLKDDAVACREEGLKQNSELTCVVTDVPAHGGGSSDESSSASDLDFRPPLARTDRAYSAAGPRGATDGSYDDAHKSRRHKTDRSGTRRPHRGRDDSGSDGSGGDHYLRPQSSHRTGHGHSSKSAPTKSAASTSRPTTPSATAVPAATAGTDTPPKVYPKTPMGQLDAIADTFHQKWVPLCDAFLAQPPTDVKTRTMEYNKLSESILAQIIFKLDGVDTEGDPDARARRKAIIQETQGILGRLDQIGKAGGKRSP